MSKDRIKKIKAREILDSRGNPTVEVKLETDFCAVKASVPSGASTGKYEAAELRDGGKRYSGKGVLKATDNINNIIADKIRGKSVFEQKEIDDLMIELDGTEDKSNLGANAICAVSLAVCKAAAIAKTSELFEYIGDVFESLYKEKHSEHKVPTPCFNIINGGAHAGNNLDFQEFMIVPQKESFSENLKIGSEVYSRLKEILSKRYGKYAVNLGDEGGFAPPFFAAEQALEVIVEAAKSLNYEDSIKVIIDVASSQFFEQGKYKMKNNVFTKDGLKRYYSELVLQYPISGLEDPFAEDDWEGFIEITKDLGKKLIIIGDDLLVTNPDRIKEASEKKAVNAMILKINQIGTVSESLDSAALAKKFGWKIMVSHRSGETNDDFIADFAVGIKADFIKAGAPARGERLAKYNRLLEIEENIS